MTQLTDLLAAVTHGVDPGPFALLRRDGADELDLFTGPVDTAEGLTDIPLPPGPPGARTLALVPYRQITERGFACVDDGAPLEFLQVSAHQRIALADALAALPDEPVHTTDAGFDVSDEEYARTVQRVLSEEIGRGEGANFVIHRALHATV
ncbi:chorismate-binding protein, partial [Micromonospora sp. M51]|nr:chorismate-binding protein [Micromonospora sp. M51]